MSHDLPAVQPGTGPNVDQVIRRADRVLVVLDNQNGVADVGQMPKCGDQPVVIALMQPDGRLIENIAAADQSGADLRSQPDTLTFPAGQRPGRAVEVQVSQPHAEHESQAGTDLFQNRRRDLGLLWAELELFEERRRLLDGHRRDTVDWKQPKL